MNQRMKETVDFLYNLPRFTKKNSLMHTRRLMELLGQPCGTRKVIHVAGSNGKGSVCCFLYHMLLAGNISCAMFTSPHLTDIRERFQINGNLVSEEEFLAAFDRVREAVRKLTENGGRHPTFFEYVFAIAMVLFEEAQAEYIILETGLGGRLDATNSFPTPHLCVITPISLEHTDILGTSIEEIAAEKAGILKDGVPVVYAANNPAAAGVIEERAKALHCPSRAISETAFQIYKIKENAIDFFLLSDYDKKTTWRVYGHALYQVENASFAIEAVHMLRQLPHEEDDPIDRIDDAAMKKGILAARWPGRMQEVLPDIYLDGAHNPDGILAFSASVKEIVKDDALPPILLFSMLKEKDIETSVKLLTSELDWDAVAVTTLHTERSAGTERMELLFDQGRGHVAEEFSDYREAFLTMRKRRREGQKLFCTGSLYFIGAVLELLEEETGGNYGF